MTSPSCFVAMPLTVPVDRDYGGDRDHFLHVLDHLFEPAIEKAGLRAVRPIMTGSDVIQAEIIKNLEESDMVLCDISGHNPNVFFELGIRTALDRPVALVRDNLTDKLPFDTGIINTHTYDSALTPWQIQAEVDSLAGHIAAARKRASGSNALWKYFGLTQRGTAPQEVDDPVSAKLDLLLAEVGHLRIGRTDGLYPRVREFFTDAYPRDRGVDELLRELEDEALKSGAILRFDGIDENRILLDGEGKLTKALVHSLSAIAGRRGFELGWVGRAGRALAAERHLDK